MNFGNGCSSDGTLFPLLEWDYIRCFVRWFLTAGLGALPCESCPHGEEQAASHGHFRGVHYINDHISSLTGYIHQVQTNDYNKSAFGEYDLEHLCEKT